MAEFWGSLARRSADTAEKQPKQVASANWVLAMEHNL